MVMMLMVMMVMMLMVWLMVCCWSAVHGAVGVV